MRETAWVLGVALVLGACGSSADGERNDFAYNEADIQALVVGQWSGAWRTTPGSTARFSLDVTRPTSPETRATCASRSFSAASASDAPAQRVSCVAMSTMRLEADLSVDDGSLEPAALDGDLTIVGLELHNAALTLSDGTIDLRAIWDAGSWHDCRASRPSGAIVAECALEARVP